MVHDTCGRDLLAQTIVRVLNAARLTRPDTPSTICPEILFVDSRLASMIGFADLCAYAVRTYLVSRCQESRLFRRIEQLFHYAKHESNKPACDCAICADYEQTALNGCDPRSVSLARNP